MKQEIYQVKLKNIFKGILNKELYHFQKFIELPFEKNENQFYHIHFIITITSVKNDAIIGITPKAIKYLEKNEIEYTNLFESIWKDKEKKLLFQELISKKQQLAYKILDYLEKNIVCFEDFRAFTKYLRNPKRVFHNNFYKCYNFDMLNHIWDKINLSKSTKLNPIFLETNNKLKLKDLFIRNANGFMILASDVNGEYDIEVNGFKSSYPIIYKSKSNKKETKEISWDYLFDLIGVE